MDPYDVVVVGGSAAGLSAALVLSRARRRVVVVDAGAPRNAPASHMHGYLSRDGLPPSELLATGRREVAGYGGGFEKATVVDLVPDGPKAFWVLLDGGRRLRARKLVVATGLRDELPQVPGLLDRWARDVLHCPYCHGHEVADRPLGVLGWGPGSVRYAQVVRQWTSDLVLFAMPDAGLTNVDRHQLAARGIAVVEGDVDGLEVEDDRLVAVRSAGGRAVAREALFVQPRLVPNHDLLTHLGADVGGDGWVVTDGTGRTSVSGVWAAGNVVDPRAQVITAAGEGSAAAIALNAELVEDDVHRAVEAFDHGYSS